MKALFRNYGFIIFIVVALLHLLAIGFEIDALRTYTKPLLLPVLATTVYSSAGPANGRNIFIGALLFSFLGDVLLMCEHLNPLYFIFGLVSFLLAHVLYILFFTGIIKRNNGSFRLSPIITTLVILYGLCLVIFLWPSLADLKIPVAVYALVICSMLLSSIAVSKIVNKTAAMFFVVGALLFVCSDSMLALNKFYQPFYQAPILIMLTYCAAQYFLTKGFLSYRSS